jgi:hypothetical protein
VPNKFYLINQASVVVRAKLLIPDDSIVEGGNEQDVRDGQQIGEDQIKVFLVYCVKKVVISCNI